MLLLPGSLGLIFNFFLGGGGRDLGGRELASQQIVNVGLHVDGYQHSKTSLPFNLIVN